MIQLRWAGMKELIEALAKAPDEVRAEGMSIVRDATEATKADVLGAYAEVTGNLKARVQTSYPSSDLLVGIVQSTSPHSHLYEFGTGPRSFNGAKRGIMPAAKVLVPAAQRHRAEMYERLKVLVTSKGFHVSE